MNTVLAYAMITDSSWDMEEKQGKALYIKSKQSREKKKQDKNEAKQLAEMEKAILLIEDGS